MANALQVFLNTMASGGFADNIFRSQEAALARQRMLQQQRQFDATLPIRQSQADAAMLGAQTGAGRLKHEQQKWNQEPARQEAKYKRTLGEKAAAKLDPTAIAVMGQAQEVPFQEFPKLHAQAAKREAEQEGRKAFAREGAKTWGAGERSKLKGDPQREMRRRMYESRYYKLEQDLANVDKIVAAGRAKGENWPDADVIRQASMPILAALKQAAQTGEFVPVGGGAVTSRLEQRPVITIQQAEQEAFRMLQEGWGTQEEIEQYINQNFTVR